MAEKEIVIYKGDVFFLYGRCSRKELWRVLDGHIEAGSCNCVRETTKSIFFCDCLKGRNVLLSHKSLEMVFSFTLRLPIPTFHDHGIGLQDSGSSLSILG